MSWHPIHKPLSDTLPSATHLELQPHKFAAAWTTTRIAPFSAGGHFYYARHGVRVRSAADTLVIWKPGHYHGTSLLEVEPKDPNPALMQGGLSIVTSNRLPGVWRKYAHGSVEHRWAEANIDVEEQCSDGPLNADE